MKPVKHPAKFSLSILVELEKILAPYHGNLLDGFAGTGRIHELARPGLQTWGIEIEPEWASMHPRTLLGDALNLPFKDESFSIYCTSPVYGNRFADHHHAKDASTRRSYTHDLGRAVNRNSLGTIHFGERYKYFHKIAWQEAYRVLKPGGLMIVNVSNFIKNFEEVHVVGWHALELAAQFRFHAEIKVATPRMRYGANHKARVETESILIAYKEAV